MDLYHRRKAHVLPVIDSARWLNDRAGERGMARLWPQGLKQTEAWTTFWTLCTVHDGLTVPFVWDGR